MQRTAFSSKTLNIHHFGQKHLLFPDTIITSPIESELTIEQPNIHTFVHE